MQISHGETDGGVHERIDGLDYNGESNGDPEIKTKILITKIKSNA